MRMEWLTRTDTVQDADKVLMITKETHTHTHAGWWRCALSVGISHHDSIETPKHTGRESSVCLVNMHARGSSRWCHATCRSNTPTCMWSARAWASRWPLFQRGIHQHRSAHMKNTFRVSPAGTASVLRTHRCACQNKKLWPSPLSSPQGGLMQFLAVRVQSENESRCCGVPRGSV